MKVYWSPMQGRLRVATSGAFHPQFVRTRRFAPMARKHPGLIAQAIALMNRHTTEEQAVIAAQIQSARSAE